MEGSIAPETLWTHGGCQSETKDEARATSNGASVEYGEARAVHSDDDVGWTCLTFTEEVAFHSVRASQ